MRNVVLLLVDRYLSVCDRLDTMQKERVMKMLTVLRDKSELWPMDKTNRWIGFIQGVLWSANLLNIDEERDFTRPLFHEYYRSTAQNIPNTVDVLAVSDD